jgi:UDP-2-acetamido-3-amino-2,3-dideoxy-glucuronate N-acetyltransferase
MKDYFVHEKAICESEKIGKNTRIWAFCHIMKDVEIGEDCNFGDGSFVESGVKIGNRVTVKNHISIWNGVEIEDDVFLGPNCVLTNDLFPRSKVYHPENIRTLIRKGASIGANATIVCGITLGKYSMVAAGAVVTKDVPDFALMVGVPAKISGYVSLKGDKLEFDKNGFAKDKEGNVYQKENEIVKIKKENN